MTRSLYFVSVGGRSVLNDQQAASYEWVIEATPEQADYLRGLLSLMQEKEEEAFPGYIFPWPDTEEASVNSLYEQALQNVYNEIYQLGTRETRSHLAQYGIVRHSVNGNG
ncbi:hypothetical protein ACFSVM_21810 [Paenibacillus shunpengii]|uniref:Uncharacterized protein n=1 Tax=Paenibacillus shunpengii TaxID=2054424 RepID=A0ABW5SUX1_9BACL|nr:MULTISPECIES: hypothetical protein [unclassified Paenibacillus]OMC64976.1 hypothetical protein BK126_24450 [Paenibacillus sp. FSL H7-0326]SDX52133.1 hypothetical protein SAMN05518848_108197 [Paenibacillus sp. PDC88]